MAGVTRWVWRLAIACAFISIGFAARSCGTALVVERPLQRPDAIVSLASHEWERLPETARLAAQYPDAKILLTLPTPITEFNCHDCNRRVVRLARMGVNDDRIFVLPLQSPGTRGEALAALRFAPQAEIHRLMVVTSPYHTRRALATFEKIFAGSDVEIGISPVHTNAQANPTRWWGTPYDRWYVRYEWLATVYYALRYGILVSW